jgi:ABC-type Na+ efflux pump permease subunit
VYETSADETTIAVTGDSTELVHDADHGIDDIYFFARETQEDALNSVEGGTLDAALILEDVEGSPRTEATLYVPDGELKSTIAIDHVSRVLEQVEREQRISLAGDLQHEILSFPSDAPDDTHFTFLYTTLIPLLVFLPVFLAGAVAVDVVSEERDGGTFEILQVTPLTMPELITAKAVMGTLFGASQVALWMGLLSVAGVVIQSPGLIVVMGAALSLLATILALGIVLVIPERRFAQFLYSAALLAALVFLGVLPQHPANSVSQLAIGNAPSTAYLTTALVLVLGGLAWFSVRESSDWILRHSA